MRLLLFISFYRFSLIVLGGISGSTKILLMASLMLVIFNIFILKLIAIGGNITLKKAAEAEQNYIFGGIILGVLKMNFM